MRRMPFHALCVALVMSATAVVWFSLGLWGAARDNAAIRSLASGKDVELREAADPRAVYARILYLALRDRTEEAQGLLPHLADSPAQMRAQASYSIGNARMRAGFDQIDRGAFDDAVPQVNLAKSAYRDALRANPNYMSAKVNLDLAMNLVRDLPRPEQAGNEDEDAQTHRLWTDLPGLPRGAP